MAFTYANSYIVSLAAAAFPLGVVRRDGAFWRYLVFADGPQSKEVFKTREAAATALAKRAGAFDR